MTTATAERRIYVACLASYNAGILHGRWIDADQTAEEITEEVERMLEDSPEPNIVVRIGVCQACDKRFRMQVRDPDAEAALECPECGSDDVQSCRRGDLTRSAEEWAIHDHEGFEGLNVGEWESFEKIAEWAELLEKHGPAYAAYAGNVGEEYADAAGFVEAYQGEYKSERAYAEEYADAVGLVDESSPMGMYFDWDSFASDLFMDSCYSITAPGGMVYVFRSI